MITRNLDTNAQMTRVSSMDPYVLISAKVCTSNGILSKTGGGGGSNNKKDHAAGKNLRCPLSFLFFFVLFQNTFKIDVFVSNLVKNVSSKKNKKDHDFRIF